jgi:hypothetical protein
MKLSETPSDETSRSQLELLQELLARTRFLIGEHSLSQNELYRIMDRLEVIPSCIAEGTDESQDMIREIVMDLAQEFEVFTPAIERIPVPSAA